MGGRQGKPNREEETGRHVTTELETRVVWPKTQEMATDSRRQKKKEISPALESPDGEGTQDSSISVFQSLEPRQNHGRRISQ